MGISLFTTASIIITLFCVHRDVKKILIERKMVKFGQSLQNECKNKNKIKVGSKKSKQQIRADIN